MGPLVLSNYIKFIILNVLSLIVISLKSLKLLFRKKGSFSEKKLLLKLYRKKYASKCIFWQLKKKDVKIITVLYIIWNNIVIKRISRGLWLDMTVRVIEFCNPFFAKRKQIPRT